MWLKSFIFPASGIMRKASTHGVDLLILHRQSIRSRHW